MDLLPGALCTLDDIKSIDSGLGHQSDDEIIALINFFTQLAESPTYCNRQFAKKEYIEYFDGLSHRRLFTVSAPPIDIDTIIVFDDPEREFSSSRKVLDKHVAYTIFDGGPTVGPATIKTIRGYTFQPYARNIKVIYTGGLVVNNGSNEIECPSALRMAAAAQVRFWFKNKNNLGVSNYSNMTGSISYTSPKLLDHVKMTLLAYRKFD